MADAKQVELPLLQRLMAARRDMGGIQKDKTADTGKYTYDYASLSQVIRVVSDALEAHGLMMLETLDSEHLMLSVTDGTERMQLGSLPIAYGGDWQKNGSAITYARRYLMMTAFGLAAEDDDGMLTKGTVPPQRERLEKLNRGFNMLKDMGGNPAYVVSGYPNYERDAVECEACIRALSDAVKSMQMKNTVQQSFPGAEVTEVM